MSTADRRPLKTRSWKVFQSLAGWLARAGVSPNMISVASVVFAILGSAGLLATDAFTSPLISTVAWATAIGGIQLRLIANLLDGMLAVEAGQASATGPLYNEVPDRLSDPILLIAAGHAYSGSVDAGWAAACMALLVAYTRAIAASVGTRQLFLGPMAKQHRMALLTFTCIAGLVLPRPWMIFPMGTDRCGVVEFALWLIVAGGIVTVIRRLRAAANFLRESQATELDSDIN